MKAFHLAFMAGFLAISCDDLPPEVIRVEDPETPKSKIDQYYYVQFQWGKPSNRDTITMEVPDDTAALNADGTWDLLNDYYNTVFELKNEPIRDTTDADILDFHYRIGWHYSPVTMLYTRSAELTRRQGTSAPADELEDALKSRFAISFPWKILGDTLPFWDIEDYFANPSIREGIVQWGRDGNNIEADTLWNNDAYTGIVLSYTDTAGVEWRTDNPPTFQQGEPKSFFYINSITRNTRPDEPGFWVIEGEFTARVYNDGQTQRLMHGGKFRLPLLTDDIELGEQPE